MADAAFFLPEALTWRSIDGEWLVYQARTGLMLQVDAMSGAVLSLLEEGPATSGAVADRLATATELPCDPTLKTAARTLLSQLCALGLVSDGQVMSW